MKLNAANATVTINNTPISTTSGSWTLGPYCICTTYPLGHAYQDPNFNPSSFSDEELNIARQTLLGFKLIGVFLGGLDEKMQKVQEEIANREIHKMLTNKE